MAANQWYASIPNLKDIMSAMPLQQQQQQQEKKKMMSRLKSTSSSTSSSSSSSSSSSRYDAVLLSTPVITLEALHYLSTHISNILLLTKPHAIAISTLNMVAGGGGIPVFDSTVHLQYFLNRCLNVPHNNTQLIPGNFR